MLPPPPTSTLFPYTTLFRSDTGSASNLLLSGNVTLAGSGTVTLSNSSGNRIFGQSTGQEDRKSTRLNSSHVAISYAVFCLKKKNQRPNRAYQLTPRTSDPRD